MIAVSSIKCVVSEPNYRPQSDAQLFDLLSVLLLCLLSRRFVNSCSLRIYLLDH